MERIKVVKISQDGLEFDNGTKMYSDHESDCCERHWLDFEHLSLDDFSDLEFDLSGDSFFKKIDGYGIELIPVSGHSVKIAGYGANNGYYSTELTLVISNDKTEKRFDITECQEISG